MRAIFIGVTWILLGIAGSGFAQILTTPGFSRAFHDGVVIKFDAPPSIDWPSFAPSDLSRITDPGEALRQWEILEARRNMFDNAEFEYAATIPYELIDTKYYLIGADGITAIVPTHLAGTVRFMLHRSEQRIERRIDYGKIAAEARNRVQESGGFVFSDPVRAPVQVSASDLDVQDLVLNSALDRERGLESGDPLSELETSAWKILKQYSFAVDGSRPEYAFIQWATTGVTFESSCRFRYAIVALEPHPRVIATNNYGCDI